MQFTTKVVIAYTFVLLSAFVLCLTCIGLLDGQQLRHERRLQGRLALESALYASQASLLRHQRKLDVGAPADIARSSARVEATVNEILRLAPVAAEGAVAEIARKAVLDGLNKAVTLDAALTVLDAQSKELQGRREEAEISEEHDRRKDLGLITGAAAFLFLVVVGIRKWVFASTAETLERFAAGLEGITSGNLDRRIVGGESHDIFGQIAAGINELADRLQRASATPRDDVIVLVTVLERYLAAEDLPCGILTDDSRLLAANEKARELSLKRHMSLYRIAALEEEREPGRVDRTPIELTDGERVGTFLRLRTGS